jgi:hypothetical protein
VVTLRAESELSFFKKLVRQKMASAAQNSQIGLLYVVEASVVKVMDIKVFCGGANRTSVPLLPLL